MRSSTIFRLNQLNYRFYETISQEFSQTREQPWEGWFKLISIIEKLPVEISILDVGCGNGRFFEFLQVNFPDKRLSYLGVDNSDKLLQIAINQYQHKNLFQKIDILSQGWVEKLNQEFDLVVAFGVLHHIPGKTNRHQFIDDCYTLTAKRGKMIITAWQFADQEKWKKRIIPFSQISLQSTEVEENDFLIDWQRGKEAIRYCHHTSKDELVSFFKKYSSCKLSTFVADGKTWQDNVYCILQKDENYT